MMPRTTKRPNIPENMKFSPHNVYGTKCTECHRWIYGRLFACFDCENYMLCHECERSGTHCWHPMLRVAHPDAPRELRAKGSDEFRAVEDCLQRIDQQINTKFEQVTERITTVEVAIKNHQVTQRDNPLPAPIIFRSERNKKHNATRSTKKPKLVPYPLPTSWTESLHETREKAKMDTRFAEKKKAVVIERLPETTNQVRTRSSKFQAQGKFSFSEPSRSTTC